MLPFFNHFRVTLIVFIYFSSIFTVFFFDKCRNPRSNFDLLAFLIRIFRFGGFWRNLEIQDGGPRWPLLTNTQRASSTLTHEDVKGNIFDIQITY